MEEKINIDKILKDKPEKTSCMTQCVILMYLFMLSKNEMGRPISSVMVWRSLKDVILCILGRVS